MTLNTLWKICNDDKLQINDKINKLNNYPKKN